MLKKLVLYTAAALACVASAEDIDWTDRAVRRQAVLETAYAYYLKADCVQYDSTPLMLHRVGVMSSRRTKEGTPEDATPDKTYYTVCSSFPYETYWNALGYRLGGASDACYTMALTTRPQETVVFEYDKRRDRDGSRYVPEMMRMRSLLEPGDVIVYTTFKEQKTKTGTKLKGGGHALMYVGDVAGDGHNKVMHSGGAKYQFENGGYDQVEWSGTIRLDDMDGIFFHGRAMRKKTKIMVFRPLQLPASKYPLTDSAKARYKYPRLRCDRRAEVGVYGSVVSGGTLGYSIRLRNFSKKSYTVPVREKVPEGAEFLPQQSMGGLAVCDGKTFGWDIPLAPGEERVVTWRVRVTAPAGKRIVATGGTAAGIPSNTIETDVVLSRMSAACARAWAQANVHDVTALPDCRVRAWAGGRRNPDPPRGVRVADPRARHLMEGDVVVVCRRLSKPKDFRLWTMGRGGLEEMTPHGIRWVTDAEVESLLAADFFAALRPAVLPGVAEEWNRRQHAVVATALACHRTRNAPYHGDLSFVNDVFRDTIGYALCADPANTSVSNLVEAPPPGTLVFAYDRRKDPGQKRFWDEMARMWSLLEPGDVVAIMSDGPDLTGRKTVPPVNAAMLFVGDPLGDGHAQKLMVTGEGADAADPLGRLNGAINKSMFDCIQHGRSRYALKNRTKIVVLRPLQLPAAKSQLVCAQGAAPAAAKLPSVPSNLDFEEDARHWRVPRTKWRVEDGAGRGGSKGMVCENDDPRSYSFPGQRIALEGGAVYRFGCWVKAGKIMKDGKSILPSVSLDWSDANGKWLSAAYAFPVAGNEPNTDGWVRYEGLTSPLPDEAVSGTLLCFLPRGATGKVQFDDYFFKPEDARPVDWLMSSAYRNTAADGTVAFHVNLYVNRVKHPLDTLVPQFVYKADDGRTVAVAPDEMSPRTASVAVPVKRMAEGPQTVAFVLRNRADGKELGRAECTFTRGTVARRVAFDRFKRTLVDGKPFLPLGMYASVLSDEAITSFTNGVFNCIMPYNPKREQLDAAHAAGLKVIYSVKDMVWGSKFVRKGMETREKSLAAIREVVEAVKDHPALLAWYVNDEAPERQIGPLREVNELIHALDPDHPTWAVTDKPWHVRPFVGSYDCIGMDPYPIGNNRGDIDIAGGWALEARAGSFDVVPMWHVPQCFNWKWYRRSETNPEFRFPTREELDSMFWQAIAAGANGLVPYAFHGMRKNLKGADYDKAMGDVKSVMASVKRREAIILSDPGPSATADATNLLCRTWTTADGETWLLLSNANRARVTATVKLGASFRAAASEVGVSSALAAPDVMSVALPPLASGFVRLVP